MSMLIRAKSDLEALVKTTEYLNQVAYTTHEIPGRYADEVELRVPELESP